MIMMSRRDLVAAGGPRRMNPRGFLFFLSFFSSFFFSYYLSSSKIMDGLYRVQERGKESELKKEEAEERERERERKKR